MEKWEIPWKTGKFRGKMGNSVEKWEIRQLGKNSQGGLTIGFSRECVWNLE